MIKNYIYNKYMDIRGFVFYIYSLIVWYYIDIRNCFVRRSKMTESRNEKFKRLASQRMTRIFQTANLLANLSNRANYLYDKSEIDEIFEAYYKKGRETKAFFEKVPLKEKLETEFKFSNTDKVLSNKEEKFKRLAEQRLTKIFQDLELISRLSNRKHYTYSAQEIDALFTAFEEKGEEIRVCFEPLEPLKDHFSFESE
ncbi:conserved hypothetical protein [Bacillus thuringiensis str. Al Hakam]|nr:conserved hypothetical protein [Bacillus thuringiensis str. Al Hakam]